MRLMEYALSKEEVTMISIDTISISTVLCFQEVIYSITEEPWEQIIKPL